MKQKLHFLWLILVVFSAFAQEREATIYFNDSTSIKGFAEINRGKIHFRVSQEDQVTEWSHDMAKGVVFSAYGFSEKYEYVIPEKDKDPEIMEVLEEGNLCLYKRFKKSLKFGVGGQINSAGGYGVVPTVQRGYEALYYVKRKEEKHATDLEFSFRSRAFEYFSDCPELQEKIETRKLKAKDIEKVVYYYNDYCGDEWED